MDVKPFWQSKTFWVNFLTFLVGLLTYLNDDKFIASYPQATAVIVTCLGIANIALRFVTWKPISLGIGILVASLLVPLGSSATAYELPPATKAAIKAFGAAEDDKPTADTGTIDGPQEIAAGDFLCLTMSLGKGQRVSWSVVAPDPLKKVVRVDLIRPRPDDKDGLRKSVFVTGAGKSAGSIVVRAIVFDGKDEDEDGRELVKTVMVRDGPKPLPKPDDPPPTDNPFAEPTDAMKSAVQPLASFQLKKPDAEAIAKNVANQAIRIATTPKITNYDIRQGLVSGGVSLGLKGKYPGLADALEKVTKPLAGDVRPANTGDGELLAAIAWQIWECGVSK